MTVLLVTTAWKLRLVERESGVLVQDDEDISAEYMFDEDEVDKDGVLRSRFENQSARGRILPR